MGFFAGVGKKKSPVFYWITGLFFDFLNLLAVWTGQIGTIQMLYIQTITKLRKTSPPPAPFFENRLIIKYLAIISKCD